MKINGDILIDTQVDGTIYANHIKSKNLFDINGLVNIQLNNGAIVNRNVVNGNILTANTNGWELNPVGQKIVGLRGKTVTFSARVISTGTGELGSMSIYYGGSQVANARGSAGETISTTYTCTGDDYLFGFATSGSSLEASGKGAKFTDIQVEINDTKTDYTDYERTNNNPYILWTNPDTSVDFPITTVTLSDYISKYKFYEIIYRVAKDSQRYCSTGKIPACLTTEIRTTATMIARRPVTSVSGNQIAFSSASYYATYGSGADTYNNAYIIPYQVLGYK